jgi:hypothetical protein
MLKSPHFPNVSTAGSCKKSSHIEITMHARKNPNALSSLCLGGGGTYKSIGNLSSSHCWDTAPIPDNAEQIKGLPFEAWQGEVDTNYVWINVMRAGSSTTARKSP